MSSVVYPLPGSKEIYTIINSSFSNKKIVKIKNFGTDPCSLDALLMSISKEYQDAYDSEKRDSLVTKFRQEFKNYILAPSKESDTSLFKKIMKAYELSTMKDKFRIKSIGDRKNIYDLIIVKKPNDEDKYLNFRLSYPLFSTETKNTFLPNSNLFSLLDETFLKDMIEQRYITKVYAEKIKKLDELLDEEEDMMKKKEMEVYKEILEFNLNRRNNMSPENLFNIIDSDFCKNEDIILRLISCVLKFNVFLCRSWNTEMSVVKRMVWDKDYNYIILFKTDTPVSLTGIREDVRYESGGIKSSFGISTILEPGRGKTIISDLNQICNNDIDSYYLDKYLTYLNKLEPNIDMNKIENSYEQEDSSTSSEEEDSESEMDEERNDEMDQEGSSVLVDETKPLSENINEEEATQQDKGDPDMEYVEYTEDRDPVTGNVEYTEEDNTYIPAFIRGYTDIELTKLLEIFVDPQGDYKNMSREKLELLYKNYLMSNLDENVDQIMDRVTKEEE